ncbi:hypothetical protein ACA910_009189, partial [Epithemia clementina (nom. ined.)]
IQRIPCTDVVAAIPGTVQQTLPFFYKNRNEKDSANDQICFLLVAQGPSEEEENEQVKYESEGGKLEEQLFLVNLDYSAAENTLSRQTPPSSSRLPDLLPSTTSLHSGIFLKATSCAVSTTAYEAPILVCCAAGIHKDPAIVWFDPIQFKPIQVHRVVAPLLSTANDAHASHHAPKAAHSRMEVVALTSIVDGAMSNQDTSCVAFAVQTLEGSGSSRNTNVTCTILIVQAVLSGERNNVSPQVIFQIPLSIDSPSNDMGLSLSSAYSKSFALRAGWKNAPSKKHASFSEKVMLWDFVPNAEKSEMIARAKFLLAQGSFDEADQLLSTEATKTGAKAVKAPFSNFDVLEVPWLRLKKLVLSTTPINEEVALTHPAPYSVLSQHLRQVKDCISRLSVDPHRLLGVCELLWESPNDHSKSLKDLLRLWSFVDLHLKKSGSYGEDDNRQQLIGPMQRKVHDRIMALQLVEQFCEPHQVLVLPLDQVTSTDTLVSILIQEECYDTVAKMWTALGTTISGPTDQPLQQESAPRATVSVDALLLAICEHCGYTGSSGMCPREPSKYMGLLRHVILPSLAVNHPLLGLLRAWSCQTANGLDDHGNLGSAIELLRAMHNGIKDLQLRVHASFAERSPFINEPGQQGHSKRSPASTASRSLSLSSGRSSALKSLSGTRKVSATVTSTPLGELPIPSVLQLGQIQSGATAMIGERRRLANRIRAVAQAADFSLDEDNEQCVEEKLKEALCLQTARKLGLPTTTCSLRHFQGKGGFRFCVKQIIFKYCQERSSSETNGNESLAAFLVREVEPFSASLGVDFDEALLELVSEICKGKDLSTHAMRQSSFLARCCRYDVAKCRGTLNVMHAALFCGIFPRWLMHMSEEAKAWSSSDAGLCADVQEVTRLLTIHRIIADYCGQGARELFRVENPRHATRLLTFMTKHVQFKSDVIVGDVLALCQSFTHLCAKSAFSCLLTNAISFRRGADSDCDEKCNSLFQSMLKADPKLAEDALSKVLQWALERLREDRSACDLPVFANGIDSVPHEYILVCDLVSLYKEYQRMHNKSKDSDELANADLIKTTIQLQRKLGLLVAPSDFALAPKLIRYAAAMLEPAAQAFASNQLGLCKMAAKKAQKACSLLLLNKSNAQAQSLWTIGAAKACCARIKMGDSDFRHDEFLRFLGLIDGGETSETAALASLSVGFSLCEAIFSDNDDGYSAPNGNPDELCFEVCRDLAVGTSLIQHKSLWMVSCRSLPRVAWINTLIDTAGQLFSRTDMGFADTFTKLCALQLKKSWNDSGVETMANTSNDQHQTIVEQPVLNPLWYVGDGLMLPPNETLVLASWSFRELQINKNRGRSGTLELLDLACLQGSHSVALRIMATTLARDTSCKQRCGWPSCDEGLLHIYDETILRLAERCLGGSTGGMTSGVIDSQLATSFLLAMSKKTAFKLYKSSIPMALKTSSYDRLLALANVGRQACLRDGLATAEMFGGVGWRNQKLFHQQCEQLSCNALWWSRLSTLSVEFDPKSFSGTSNTATKTTAAVHSGETIQSNLISAVSRAHGVERAMVLGLRFASVFGQSADFVVLLVVTFLCTPPSHKVDDQNEDTNSNDIRRDMKYVARAVRNCIRKVRSCSKRVAILRECLVALESNPEYGVHYERFALVLSLYHENLLLLLDHDTDNPSMDKEMLEIELELVDRRRDSLAILSAHFTEMKNRPNFGGFFLEIKSFLQNHDSETPLQVNVLGQKDKSHSESPVFDPLEPLNEIMTGQALDMSAAGRLAPLCLSLGLPQGYIHARFLVARFVVRSDSNMALPSFENDVSPVVHKLRSPRDKMMLVEWCAERYRDTEKDRLACVELALEAATQASHELESGRRPSSTGSDEKEELYGHIKRLSKTKIALSDRLEIKSILKSDCKHWQDGVSAVVDMILDDLEEASNGGREPSPDELIDFLLSRGSHHAANASIDEDVALSSSCFRSLVKLVARAGKFLEGKHSHIYPEASAKRLARRLLFCGNEVESVGSPIEENVESGYESDDTMGDLAPEDDTINFVMDLANAQRAVESSHLERQISKRNKPTQKTSDEEPFSSKPCSPRELNEYQCRLASLRSVFLLAFADVYARSSDTEQFLDEACQSTPSKTTDGPSTQQKRGALQSKLRREYELKRDDLMFDSARDLLRIVFADAETASAILSQNASFALDSSHDGASNLKHHTVTYSMRHRALRTAAFLFPQKVLQRIVSEDKHFANTRGHLACSLKDCSFGTFVAKEIEEMGLTLPHSDLARLSSMDFPSYSRALWRNHGARDLKGSRGRLLLLLFEMGLRCSDPDVDFLQILVGDMERNSLPRTLLLSLEALVMHRQTNGSGKFARFGAMVDLALNALLASLNDEVQGAGWDEESEDQWLHLVQTIKRLCRLVHTLKQHASDCHHLCLLVVKTEQAVNKLKNERLALAIQEISTELTSQTT